MGQQQSKDELLYQQVNYGNTDGIRALRNDGAGLEVSHQFHPFFLYSILCMCICLLSCIFRLISYS